MDRKTVSYPKPGFLEAGQNGSSDSQEPDHGTNGNGTKPWINHNVLFVHDSIDDSNLSYQAMRLLAHLMRRVGNRNSQEPRKNPGIRRVAKDCRMNVATVERALRELESHEYLKIERRGGRPNDYTLNVTRDKLYVDYRLDDSKLLPSEFRVLMHMARLATADEIGKFFISVRKFAKTCRMKRETVNRALERLEALELYYAYDTRENPMYCLALYDQFPRVTKSGMSKIGNGVAPFR